MIKHTICLCNHYQKQVLDIKVVERTVNMLAPDEDIAQSEDTMTLLNTYIDDLSTDLNKSKIKDILRETYQQACEVL